MVMPILIIGSMFTLLRNFPIPAWIDFLKTTMVQPDKSLFALLAIPSACTVSLMAIFLAFNIGYNFAEHIGIKDRASAGIVSLVSWFILMPQVTEFSPEEGVEPFLVDSIPLAWTGAKGVFIAMIVGFFAVGVFGYIIKKDWTIKMPEGVPPTVARAFSALIPMTVAFTAVWLVGIVFIISPWGNAFNFIYAILQAPLTSLGGTVWALAFSYVLASGFWFIGIHGSSVRKKIIKWASRVPANRLSHCRQIRLNSGQTLVHMLDRVDNVYILCRGTVRTTSHNSAGSTYVIDEYRAPVAFGEMEVISESPFYLGSLTATSGCEFISVPREDYLQWIRSDPEALLTRSRWIIKNLTRQSGYERSLLTWSGTKRLMYMLSELTRDQIHRGVVEWPFTVRLTRQELADKIGTSTKTVARGIDELKERGMVSVQHGKIVITERQFQRLDDAMKHEGESHLLD